MELMACDCGYVGKPVLLGIDPKGIHIMGCPKCSDRDEVQYDLSVCAKLGISYMDLDDYEVYDTKEGT